MAQGVIPVTSLPGWPAPVAGILENMTAANGGPCQHAPDGIHVSDVTLAQAYVSAYVGGAAELAWTKQRKQTALDALFDANFDLAKFIRAGTVTTITAANVGTFLATITNNYRSLRAQIAGAADLATLSAININSGWPGNP